MLERLVTRIWHVDGPASGGVFDDRTLAGQKRTLRDSPAVTT
jgi:hypothetical protein